MRIAIIGTGYVGLVTGVCLASRGHQVICVDKKSEIVAAINARCSPLYEPGLEEILARTVRGGGLRATVDLEEAILASDVSIIAVGTPWGGDGINLNYVQEAAGEIGLVLGQRQGYHLVCVKSTVVPGTTDSVVKKILEEATGKLAGVDFGLAMNPEFLREGNAVLDFMNPDRIIIGADDSKSTEILEQVYAGFDAPILKVNLRTAEMIKYTANSLLASLISFANEISGICEITQGIDVQEVLEAVTLDKRFNPRIAGELVHPEMTSYLRAGCGFGGSCFPKDVKALIAYSRNRGYEPGILKALMTVNLAQPLRIVDRLVEQLGTAAGKKIAVLGLAFKPGTDDVRESPALAIIQELLARQARVIGVDPIAVENMERTLPLDGRLDYCSDYKAALAAADAVVLVTPWPEFREIPYEDYPRLMRYPLVVDCRRVLERRELEMAGGIYLGTGLVDWVRRGE